MKDLRERCEKLALQHRESHCKCCRNGEFEINARFDLVESIEAFAREIRNEALEEAAQKVDDVGYADTGDVVRELKDPVTLAAVAKEE